jgi:hypothetical protein
MSSPSTNIEMPFLSAGNFDGFSNANGVSSPSSSPKKGQGKRKLVSYADISQEDPAPAPPSQVLERQGSTVNDTSAGATVEPVTSGNDTQWGEVVIRGSHFYQALEGLLFICL